jgi:mannose-6-phosphate isomerase
MNEAVHRAGDGALDEAAREARRWLFEDVLPVWANVGRDRKHGGFFERIGFDGEAVAMPKRCRVQARQAYVFLEAGRLGWDGPWRDCASSGLDFMLRHHARADGLMRFKTELNGAVCDDGVDNYDQAFALFALAHAEGFVPQERIARAAEALLDALRRDRAHPAGGFYESGPDDELLLANPHMHLFEAALAWTLFHPQPPWRSFAQELGELCLARFIDPASGAVREYFEADWSAKRGERGRIIEPGHQFEWAWLLDGWRRAGGAVELSVIRRLYEIADGGGLDRAQGLALNELWIDGGVKDAGSRLWAQTERMKAALVMARLWPKEREIHEASAADAWRGVKTFIAPENPGLFRDKRRPDGGFADEEALASSLYHVTCALSELLRYVEDDRQNRPAISRRSRT